ncbi:hypothetical protein OAY14_01635 [Flavobacteriaceae bacterium]|nr:hypothetical protein [Flavobacteriaceae bacterium]
MLKRTLFVSILILLTSCGNNQSRNNIDSYEEDILGFWNRVGTIQLMNGIPVDTLSFSDSNNPDDKQIKVYLSDRVMWINNFWKDSMAPWKGGSGGYGKFNIYSRDSLTELMSHGTGLMGAGLKQYKDENSLESETWNMSINLGDGIYSQKNRPESEYAEYYEKLPDLEPKSRIDGVWKRVYEIAYVNNIPVDTTSAPSDVILDVKVMYRGRYMYQVDLTGLMESDKPLYGGFGGYGTFELDNVNGELNEYQEWGTGTSTQTFDFKTNKLTHKIKFYNDDLFLQISSGSIIGNNEATGRGLVYKRIK